MPGNYRYEEERFGGRGSARGHFGEREREDDLEEQERERFRSSEFGRDPGGSERYRGAYEGSWRDRGGRDSSRSLGGRGSSEGYDDDDAYGSPRSAGGRDVGRYGGDSGRSGRNEGMYGDQRSWERGRRHDQGRWQRSGEGTWRSGEGTWQEGQRAAEGTRGGSMQGDGWTGEPDDMRWGRQQGLYGSSEYGGYISSQRSPSEYQSHAGKGPKGWQRSDERIREEVSEALARHPEIDASEIEVRVQECEVSLTGSVTDRRAKRLAEDVAERVFGVKDVQNQIKVNTSGRSGERDVTPQPDREGRITGQAAETQSRRTGTGTTAGTTNR